MRRWRSLLVGACVLASLATAGAVELLPSIANARGQGASAQALAAPQRVIVVLKNQVTNLPPTRSDINARKQAVASIQAPVKSQLARSSASNVHSYSVLNAVAATVPKSAVASLKSNPAVSQVVPDQIIHLAPAVPPSTFVPGASGAAAAPGVCAAPGKVQLNPQALQTIHADSQNPGDRTARSLGIDGSGVTVGFIADGLDINNPDFIRANGQHVFVDYKDFSGEGTNVPTGGEEAFGDASSIAAQGRQVYNVANYGPHAVSTPCNIRVEGVAPGASLVGLDIFGAEDAGFNSSFLQAIDYAVAVDHVNVLNESLGNNYYPDDQASLDLIKRANDEAVAAGTTVTVSSGDAGVTTTIGTPASDPNVIAAGATTTYRIDLQTGYGGAQFPGIRGYLNNNISSFSSGGFEQDGRTIDVVAPGELNWALCSTDTAQYADCVSYGGKPTPVIPFGGTSESAPLTAGVAALVVQAYEKTHGTAPSPQVVKEIIASTTDDIGSPADQQGTGLVDAYKAVLAAESYKAPASAPKAAGDTLLDSATQLNAVADPGTPRTFTDTITNNGRRPQTVAVSTRTLGAYQTLKQTQLVLSDTASPHTTDWAGVADNYEKVTFRVPAGENRLNVSIAFQNASATDLNARVRLTLVDPRGNLAAYSVPQGDGNYGNAQVTDPRTGTWTAYVWSRQSSKGGTTGPVVFGATAAKYVSFGRVSPRTLTLAPGASGRITLTVATPAQPGDASGAIVLRSDTGVAFGRTGTIPVTLRSLIPSGPASFTGTLTGGNGRSAITGATFYYQLDVPAGKPELNAAVKLADNPNNPFSAYLISPSGEALAFAANDLPVGNQVLAQIGAQLHVLSPAPGAWTLIVAFIPQVSGTALSEPFTVSTDEAAVPASADGLPNSPGTQLAAGKPVTVPVKITNNGSAPEAYFIDARQPATTTLSLAAQNDPATTVPLTVSSNFPSYVVPTHTTALAASASTTGPTPIEFDAQPNQGDPDIGSTVGTSVTGSFTANPIAQGLWGIAPDVVGAFGPTGAPQEPVTTAMSVTTEAFDPAVTAPTGDLWLTSTNPASAFAPVLAAPLQTVTIPVTITPTGTPGTQVTGTLYIDDTNSVLFRDFSTVNGNEVAAVPYSYTIK